MNDALLTLVVEPWEDEHQVPHLATIGVRYVPRAAEVDRSTCVVSEIRIDLWLDADSYEVDLVHPTAFDRLLWDICVRGGCCGSIIDDVPTTVDDLLPESGDITAQAFAMLVCRAEGYLESEAPSEKHIAWLEARFREHLGAASVNAASLRRNLRRPFEDA
ncbi:hypothetical protein [Sphingomonas koreensis]